MLDQEILRQAQDKIHKRNQGHAIPRTSTAPNTHGQAIARVSEKTILGKTMMVLRKAPGK